MNYLKFLLKYKIKNNINKKIVIYTVIFGNYEKLKKINYLDKNIEYICFTDQKIYSSDWKVIYVDSRDYDKIILARIFKINPHIIFDEYEKSIFIDGSIQINFPINEFINQFIGKSKIALFKHPTRNCVYKEIYACKLLKKDKLSNLNNIKKFLVSINYPTKNGLFATGFIYRIHNSSEIINSMKLITDLLLKYTTRDQLLFFYVLSIKNVEFNIINLDIFNNKYIKIYEHDKNKIMFFTKIKYFFYKMIFNL